jgi:hypothetical protein
MPTCADFEPTTGLKETLSLSPDGRHVAYVDDALGQFNVTVRHMADGPARHLSSRCPAEASRYPYHRRR